MELNKSEVAAVTAAIREVEQAVVELNDLELVMVGGGVGEIILG